MTFSCTMVKLLSASATVTASKIGVPSTAATDAGKVFTGATFAAVTVIDAVSVSINAKLSVDVTVNVSAPIKPPR